METRCRAGSEESAGFLVFYFRFQSARKTRVVFFCSFTGPPLQSRVVYFLCLLLFVFSRQLVFERKGESLTKNDSNARARADVCMVEVRVGAGV